MKSYFVYMLIPPRPTFATDMNETEAAIMRQHGRYLHRLLEQGAVLIFGLVLAPSGGSGLAVVEAETAEDVSRLGDGDPAVQSGMMTFEVGAMPSAFVRS